MNELATPTTLQEITPIWLTEALHSKESPSRASVTRYSAERIGAGKGFMNQVVRLILEYDDEPQGLPCAIIVKLPSEDPVLKTIADKLGDDRREVRFYTEVADKSNLQTPVVYYGAIDQVTGNTILLLEDLSGGRQGDSVAGCSLADAQLVVRELAEFQSAWWENHHLKQLDWMPVKDAETSIYQEMYPEAWESFVRKAQGKMPQGLLRVGERLSQDIPMIKAKLSDAPRTIIHGDYRLDNFFLSTPTESRSLVVFDWEYCARGRGTFDIATFIIEAFSPQRLRSEEIDLLREYHSILIEKGINNYSFDECVQDYRISVLEIFAFWIVVGGFCDFEGKRATIYLNNQIERMNAAIIDHNCIDLLSI